MRYFILLVVVLLSGCTETEKYSPRNLSEVSIDVFPVENSSIRALTHLDANVAFAGSNGVYGFYDTVRNTLKSGVQTKDSLVPEYRAVAATNSDFFMLSVGNPALLYKTGDDGEMKLVYTETHEKVFYDSMRFWNAMEGMAMGDPTEDCLSILLTRDGGNTWNKVSCELLPKVVEGEAAFAASNTNIAIVGDTAWIVSGGKQSRVFMTKDKGNTWEVVKLPLIQGESTQGAYTVAFYDELNGIVMGGDYTKPSFSKGNKAITQDGGKTWELVGQEQEPGYISCVQYIPGTQGNELVAVSTEGIWFSNDKGFKWKKLSEESFHTLLFISETEAIAAGN